MLALLRPANFTCTLFY